MQRFKYHMPALSRKYIIALLCTLANFSYRTSYAETSTSQFQEKNELAIDIAHEYIASFDSQVLDQQQAIDSAASEARTSIRQARPPKLDAVSIRKVIFNNILAKSDKLSATQQLGSILHRYAWGDLKLFYGTTTKPGYNLLSRINRTTTILGEAALATLLVTPTSNLEVLQERQRILQFFLHNSEQLDTFKKQLQVYQEAEQGMISLWSTTDPLYSRDYVDYMNSNFYFKKAAFNKSAGRLEFSKRLFRDFFGIASSYLNTLMVPVGAEIFAHKKMITDKKTREILWRGAIPYYGAWYTITEAYKEKGEDVAWTSAVSLVVRESFFTFGVYNGIKNYLNYSSVLRNLSLRMADLQTFMMTADQVSKTVASSPVLEELYGTHLTAVRQLLGQSTENSELGRLIDYLQKLPLTSWSYFFNNAGKLLACYKLFVEHKDAFADAMYEIGLLDAHLSFVTLLQEAAAYNSQHAYVFAQFLDRQQRTKPYIKIENMWNLFLDSKQAIGNDIEMDAAGGIRNIILTGPNAGGKSTFLTGITDTLLLAQVMGIGPADKIILTPFNKINTYIDIGDDIAAGKSLFMAEVDRAQQHIKLLKELRADEFSFSIFDEPFSGTNPLEGAAAEYSILNAIGGYTNSLNMVATHYPTVMLLEEREKDKGFANYKVYITRQGARGKLNYTYKIVPGKATQAIAIDILEQQGYDTELLKEARAIIAHPERYQATF